MWIVVRALNISQEPFCNETSCYNGRCPNDLLNCIAAEVKRILICINSNAIDLNLLAYIPGNDVGVIAILSQIIVLLLCGSVSEVKCL